MLLLLGQWLHFIGIVLEYTVGLLLIESNQSKQEYYFLPNTER